SLPECEASLSWSCSSVRSRSEQHDEQHDEQPTPALHCVFTQQRVELRDLRLPGRPAPVLLGVLVSSVLHLQDVLRGRGVRLSSSAGRLRHHPAHHHGSAGVCPPAIRHRGLRVQRLHVRLLLRTVLLVPDSQGTEDEVHALHHLHHTEWMMESARRADVRTGGMAPTLAP
ncbi:hypothetical protein CRUP_035847, partial [Coryphaenoides rupestris]